MFVDSVIVFVIVAERILRPISLSESLDREAAQLEDGGQEPHSLLRGLRIQPGPGKDRVQPLPLGLAGWLQGNQVDSGSALPLPSSCWVCGPEGRHCQFRLSEPGTQIQPWTLCHPSLCGPALAVHQNSPNTHKLYPRFTAS